MLLFVKYGMEGMLLLKIGHCEQMQHAFIVKLALRCLYAAVDLNTKPRENFKWMTRSLKLDNK
jgi:hypothetical protein